MLFRWRKNGIGNRHGVPSSPTGVLRHMPNISICHDAIEGQTRTIAQHVAETTAATDHCVEPNEIRKLQKGFSIDRFDAVFATYVPRNPWASIFRCSASR